MPCMLIDCDAFFASCEQARDPRLRGKKVVVAGDTEQRSVVTSASYAARADGVKAGMPIQEARRVVPDGIFISGDIDLYLGFNLKLLRKLRSWNHPVELYSIDEFFVDFRGSYAEAAVMARGFQEWTASELGITVSIGIAPTKVFAKLAAEMEKPAGLTVLEPTDIPGRIEHLPVRELFGVGPRTEEFLHSRGIRTIGDLRACHPLILQAELGARGQWLHDAAMGRGDGLVKVVPDPFKSMGNEMTLPADTDDPADVRSFLCYLADTVAQRLRADGSMARTIHLHVRYEDFTGFCRAKTLAQPAALADRILAAVEFLLARHDRGEKKIRLLGIGASNLIRARGYQLPLFPVERKALALAKTLDRLRQAYGQEAIGRASTLVVKPGPKLAPFAVVPGSGRRRPE